MKTLIIFNDLTDKTKYLLVSGDLSEYDNIFINSDIDPKKEEKIVEIIGYDGFTKNCEGRFQSFPLQLVKETENIAVISVTWL